MKKDRVYVQSGVINCPKCKFPHHYDELPVGQYAIKCPKCKELFTLTIDEIKVSFSSGIGGLGDKWTSINDL